MAKNLGAMFGHRAEKVHTPDPLLPLPLGKVGIEVEVENCKTIPSLDYWENKEDHSLRNSGMEFVTAGPMFGLDISKALRELFSHAEKLKWSDGYPRAGIHIHLDVRDLGFENRELARLASNYMIVEHALFAYCGEWRRQTCYCDALEDSQADFTKLGKFLYEPPTDRDSLVNSAHGLSKYQALNFRPLVEFGTIEFRTLPTTFDYERVFDWVRIILALKRSAMDTKINEPLMVLSELGPEQYARRILGETFPLLERFINPVRVWNAVDNATVLMAYGNQFSAGSKAPRGWLAPEVKTSPIVEKLIAKKAKAAKPKSPVKKSAKTTSNSLRNSGNRTTTVPRPSRRTISQTRLNPTALSPEAIQRARRVLQAMEANPWQIEEE